MGKKGKGKGKGQAEGGGDKPKKAPQQVYQPPQRREAQESGSQPQRERPPVEASARAQPGPSQEPSVAYRKSSFEEAKPPPRQSTPISSTTQAKTGAGRGRGSPQSQKSGPPARGFFEKEGVGQRASSPPSQKVGAPTSGFEKESAPKKTAPPETPSETSGKKAKASEQKIVSPVEELGFKFKSLSTHEPAKKFDIMKRPDYGKLGIKIGLYVNYFKLEYKHRTVYHYDIDISEATKDKKMGASLMSKDRTAKEDIAKKVKHVERQKRRNIGKAKCRQIIAQMIKSKALQQYSPVYDGQKNLFTNKLLPFKEKTSFPVDVKIDDEEKRFFVTIQPVEKQDKSNIIDMEPLIELYRGRSREIPLEVLLVYETIMNHRDPPFEQVQFRSSFFSLNNKPTNLGLGMEIWFGYNQSVHLTERGPVVIINLAAKAFHKACSVLDYARDVLETDIRRNPQLAGWQLAALEKALKGLSVKVTHQRHARKYKVKGLSRLPAKDIMFESQGRQINIVQYFRSQYNVTLQHPLLPCLHMQTGNPKTFIPMEVCNVVEGQPKIGKLSGDMTSRMIRSTAVPPDDRFRSISEDAKKVQRTSKSYLDAYGLIMDINLTKVDGRLITAPRLQYDGRDAAPDNRGVWRIEDGKKFYRVVSVKSWGLISFADERRFGTDVLSKYCEYLVKSARKCGMAMDRPSFIKICRRNDKTDNVISDAKRSGIDVAIVVLSRREEHRYDEVKFLADFKYRLVTQCMEDKTLGRINDQITTNVCLKLNVKLGGINHILKHNLSMFQTPVMVMGADAIHWTRGLGYPSIVSVVASYEPTANKYMLVCDTQRNERSGKISQEIIRNTKMKEITSELIEGFRVNARGHYPQKIIVFRDGVSEGQFQHAIDEEVSGIQAACQQVIGKVVPITFIVVQKKHQTRMRPQNPAQGVGRGRNVPPGTVVDRDITHPVYFDFFICSHEGIQGTSKPAHYTVLHDDNYCSPDDLQQLGHFLCHTYVRCTRSVSLPAPVLYADLACFRAKKYADLFINPDDASVSSSGEEIERDFPAEVAQAIRSMKSFENNMFYV